MFVNVHYGNNTHLFKEVINLSVAPDQGLVLEFPDSQKAAMAFNGSNKAKVPAKALGLRVISVDSTGFTAF